MKTMFKGSQIFGRLQIPILILTLSAGIVRGQDLIYMTFDTGDQGFPCGGWDGEFSYSWDSSRDGQTNSASGSLRVDVLFTNGPSTSLQTCVSVADLTPYEKMRMDVYLDPTNAPNPAGHYGTLQVRFRPGWSWPGDVFTIGTITNTGWSHFEAALPVTKTSASGINFHWTTGFTNNLDQRTIWLDNLVFVDEGSGPPPPPSLSLRKTVPGLDITTAGNPDYSRRNIATVAGLASTLGWLNSTGAVTYSMTINESVEPDSSGFAANIMLSAGTDATINASPDWNQPHGIFLEVIQNTAGSYDVSVRFKTNAPGSHGIRNTPAGLLIAITNTGVTSLVGTWALTLSNTSVSVSGPGGVSASGELPADAASLFGTPNNFWALFGAQPNQRNNRSMSLSRVHIYGPGDFTGTVDQDFTTAAALDPNLEAKEEGSGGVTLKATNTAWRVWWELPDTGFALWAAPNLTSNAWAATGLTPITQGSRRAVFTTNVTADAGFFQLRGGGGGPVSPAYLLESFESGVFTGAMNPPYTNVAQSTTTGVTDGTSSMQVNFDASQTWSWFGKNYDAATYSEWHNHSKLLFDLHRAPETFGWNLNLAVAINGAMGWSQSEVVGWTWHNAGESTSQTITWDYSAIKATAPATGTYFQLNFMARGAFDGNAYIDNVRFAD
jgi:hypothetical protein